MVTQAGWRQEWCLHRSTSVATTKVKDLLDKYPEGYRAIRPG